jgi:iron complex transport system substrate-binding protein
MKLARVVAVLLALVLAGCGVAEQDAPETTSAAGDSAAAFPVTIDHKYGATTIPAKPQRVVTLGLSDQDAVLALGVVPVGAIDWFKERPYGQWPWTKDRWGTTLPEIVGERDDFNLEKILNLKPDLILALYSGMSEQQYDELSKIAPTVGQPKGFDDYGAPWQDMTRMAGKALGLDKATESMIKDVDAQFAAKRQQLPAWQGKKVAVVDPYEPGKYAVFQKTDPKAAFMIELGLTVPDQVNEAAKDNNAAEISSERLDMIDTDLIVILAFDTEQAKSQLAADPIFQGLTAVKDGRVLYVPYSTPAIGAALSFNTVISIPYALQEFVPLLDKA